VRHVVRRELLRGKKDGQDPIDVWPGQGVENARPPDDLTRYVSDLG
jgi:hypothetical protein